jgi:hypothetical protein
MEFSHPLPECYANEADKPEAAVAYDEAYVRERFRERGLAIAEPIRFGSWCGRKQFLSYQDVVLAARA